VLPTIPARVAVISSTQSAGYGDFVKILDARWGGLDVEVAHTQVQGEPAADQMIRAIEHFSQQPELADVLVIIRGGGSADDLAVFNDEALVRAIASSRVPTMVGVGHETDVSLADMVADVRAATPSNAAQLLVPDRREIIDSARQQVRRMASTAEYHIDALQRDTRGQVADAAGSTLRRIDDALTTLESQRDMLRAYDPREVLRRGYALVRGRYEVGARVEIETIEKLITAEVTHVKAIK
jgi:exodeoxyribonuclease VII large subunit